MITGNMFESAKAGHIQRLTNEVQRLRNELEKYQWISVKDRLPDEYIDVLTYGARPSYDVVYINRLIDKNEWLYDGVTHWMPLPEPPKEDEE